MTVEAVRRAEELWAVNRSRRVARSASRAVLVIEDRTDGADEEKGNNESS